MAQAHVLSKKQASGNGCEFEYYDNIEKRMKMCGCAPIAKLANHYLCISHVVDALVYSKSFDMYGVAPDGSKFGAVIAYKEDFLALCKKEEELRSLK